MIDVVRDSVGSCAVVEVHPIFYGEAPGSTTMRAHLCVARSVNSAAVVVQMDALASPNVGDTRVVVWRQPLRWQSVEEEEAGVSQPATWVQGTVSIECVVVDVLDVIPGSHVLVTFEMRAGVDMLRSWRATLGVSS